MRSFRSLVLPLLFCLALAGCAGQRGVLTQYSTIDALLAGSYDGVTDSRELLRHGDFGIGTFQSLDGEMIVLDGVVYQARSDGKIYTPGRIGSPFASVMFFRPEATRKIDGPVTFEQFQAFVNKAVPNPNVFCAIKAEGVFTAVTYRSVPAQSKPYPPLSEVVKHQPVFTLKNVEGTLVGYRLPPFVKGINVPGFHLHFISKNHSSGGHVLKFNLAGGTLQTGVSGRFSLILPGDESLKCLDLSRDRSHELEKAEK